MGILSEKLKEVLLSVLPITVIVLILNFTLTPLPGIMIGRFLIGAGLIVIGLAIFLVGVDLGITPIGANIGSFISKSNKIWVLLGVGLLLGFFINIAEPDLQVLAGQVASVTSDLISRMSILLVVSGGIAVMLALGLARIVYNFPLNRALTVMYGIIGLLAVFVLPEILAISFDASGATTGALTVPFILALAVGVSSMKKDSKASEKDSFGLVGLASTGAIWSVLVMGIVSKVPGLTGSLDKSYHESPRLLEPFIHELPTLLVDTVVALLPILLIFIIFQLKVFRFQKNKLRRILAGLLYTYIGLVLFLTGVNAGFMNVGTALGQKIASNMPAAITVGFVFGLVTILAEPAVHVLTNQIESVTSGYIKRSTVLGALSIGVGVAVALSVIRIMVPQVELWHYLLPGYIISIALSYIAPKLFVGIAFDSGGVASGPMTATFILAFAQGVADSVAGADILRDAFGMIALVAMTPIITLQILGVIVKRKTRKKEDGLPNETV